MILSGAEARDVGIGDNKAGTTGVAFFDGADEYSHTYSIEDEADPTNAQTLSCDSLVVPDDDGSLLQEASFASMNEDGFTINWSNVHSTPKLWPAWAVGGGVLAVASGTFLKGVRVGP